MFYILVIHSSNVNGNINAGNVSWKKSQFAFSHHSADKSIVTSYYYMYLSYMAARGCKHSADAFCYVYGKFIKTRAKKYSLEKSPKMREASSVLILLDDLKYKKYF